MAALHKSKYVGYTPKCPKCGRRGYVRKFWHRRTPASSWCGPYYHVCHQRREYSTEKARVLRAKGLTWTQIHRGSHTVSHYAGTCYIGKTNPLGDRHG